MAKCKKCGAEIEFIKTEAGKLAPVDVKETLVLNKKTGLIENRRLNHFATCPAAEFFRKKK